MIYLIGGPPKCGKTTLAKKIAKKFGIPFVSSDALQTVVRAYASKYLSKKNFNKLFPHTASKGKTNDETYRRNTPDAISKNYIQQAKATYDAIDAVCSSELVDGNDYMFEGYHVTPELVARLIKKHGKKNFSAIFLIKENQAKFLKNITKSSTPNDWILSRTKKQETYEKIAEMITLYGLYFSKESKKHHFPIVNMDDNFQSQLKIAERLLLGKI